MTDEGQLSGVHEECGHAEEAHGDGGCANCECESTLGRGTGAVDGEVVTLVEAPVAEGGAAG